MVVQLKNVSFTKCCWNVLEEYILEIWVKSIIRNICIYLIFDNLIIVVEISLVFDKNKIDKYCRCSECRKYWNNFTNL